jgi:hypothetical protein
MSYVAPRYDNNVMRICVMESRDGVKPLFCWKSKSCLRHHFQRSQAARAEYRQGYVGLGACASAAAR